MSIELFVGLKIPDTTGITAFHTIEKMGYKISKLKREIYYKFDVSSDEEKFADKIGNVDILVNANKNKFHNKLEKQDGVFYILVKDLDDDCSGLLHTLQERLGLKEITKMEKGVLWAIGVGSEEVAKEIGDKLLHNENYQSMEIL